MRVSTQVLYSDSDDEVEAFVGLGRWQSPGLEGKKLHSTVQYTVCVQ